MALLGLVVAALACLTLSVALASGTWLIAFLVITGAVGVLLVRTRSPAGSLRRSSHPHDERGRVWVVDGRAQFHAPGCARLADADAQEIPYAQATADGFLPCERCSPPATAEADADRTVWVVDGRPRFHAPGCPIVGADGEEVPYAQARADGFLACEVCAPEAGAARKRRASEPTRVEPGGPQQVWVIDGRPRYHVDDCVLIKDWQPVVVPREQAVEDGFVPCLICEPVR